MPAIASCASGRHQPPVDSASSANVISPPGVGLVVSTFRPGIGPSARSAVQSPDGLPLLSEPDGLSLPLLPQDASAIASTSTRAMAAPPPRLRDPKPCLTCSPRLHVC